MPTKASIANIALRELGANTVVDLVTETSKEANLVNDLWDDLLKEVLEAHTWDFAKEVDALALNSGFTDLNGKWTYSYALPSLYIRPGRRLANKYKYERRGQNLLTNQEECVFEFIQLIDDPTKFPPHFAMALSARLRASFAIPLSKKGTRSVDFMKYYLEISLPTAQRADAKHSVMSTEDTLGHTVANDTWNKEFD